MQNDKRNEFVGLNIMAVVAFFTAQRTNALRTQILTDIYTNGLTMAVVHLNTLK